MSCTANWVGSCIKGTDVIIRHCVSPFRNWSHCCWLKSFPSQKLPLGYTPKVTGKVPSNKNSLKFLETFVSFLPFPFLKKLSKTLHLFVSMLYNIVIFHQFQAVDLEILLHFSRFHLLFWVIFCEISATELMKEPLRWLSQISSRCVNNLCCLLTWKSCSCFVLKSV